MLPTTHSKNQPTSKEVHQAENQCLESLGGHQLVSTSYFYGVHFISYPFVPPIADIIPQILNNALAVQHSQRTAQLRMAIAPYKLFSGFTYEQVQKAILFDQAMSSVYDISSISSNSRAMDLVILSSSLTSSEIVSTYHWRSVSLSIFTNSTSPSIRATGPRT